MQKLFLEQSEFEQLEKQVFEKQEQFLSASCYRTTDNLARWIVEKGLVSTKFFAIPENGVINLNDGTIWENHQALAVQKATNTGLKIRIFDLHLPYKHSLELDEWISLLSGYQENIILQKIHVIQFPSEYFCPMKKDFSTLFKNFIREC
jgi:hypothetical protein